MPGALEALPQAHGQGQILHTARNFSRYFHVSEQPVVGVGFGFSSHMPKSLRKLMKESRLSRAIMPMMLPSLTTRT